MQPDQQNNQTDPVESLGSVNDGQEVASTIESKAQVGGARKKRLSISLIITLAVIVLMVTAVIIGKFTGVMHIGLKSPSQQVSLRTIVCDMDDIEALNAFFDDAEHTEESINRLTFLSGAIQSRDNNEDDPNCQYIIWHVAMMLNDLDGMKKSLANIKRINEKGYFIDGNFFLVDSIRGIDATTTWFIEHQDIDMENYSEGEG